MTTTEAREALHTAIAHRTSKVLAAEATTDGRQSRAAWNAVATADQAVRSATSDLEHAVRAAVPGQPEHAVQAAVQAA